MSRTVGLVLLCALAIAPARARACATISEKGPVPIRGEEALIVWDEAKRTEHFVRRAFFKQAPADFGFLVPTPSKPELAEVPAEVFDRLYALYRKPPEMAMFPTRGGAIPAAATPPVQVIEQKRVAGLDATVLLASDEKALGKWLAAHRYPSTPALERWLAPYVKRRAYVTAFKLAGGAQPQATTAVRMSFVTDAPVFPYSEPPGDGVGRPFRLSVVAPFRVAGKLGAKDWRARVGYADGIDQGATRALLDGVTPVEAQRGGWITVFDEPRSVRGADDLVLSRAAKNDRVAPSITTKIEP